MSDIDINPNTAGQLKAFIERIERLSEEARTIAEDIKEIYSEDIGFRDVADKINAFYSK